MLLALLPLVAATPAGLNDNDLKQLRSIDLRLATIVHRLAVANVELCRDRAPATGIVLHAASQYDSGTAGAARSVFGFATPVAVEAVVAGSPGAQAGVVENAGVTAIGGIVLKAAATAPSSADRDAALDLLERQSSPVHLTIEGRQVSVPAPEACRVRAEIVLGPEMVAQSDGKIVQIGVRFFERYKDEETAVVVAHEMAHSILRHRVRLEEAGVKGGLLGELGRNARLGQQAETEADALGVALLYNAGYDPASAARFWQDHGADIDGGMFRSRTHPATSKRIAALSALASTAPSKSKPWIPATLAERDQPMK